MRARGLAHSDAVQHLLTWPTDGCIHEISKAACSAHLRYMAGWNRANDAAALEAAAPLQLRARAPAQPLRAAAAPVCGVRACSGCTSRSRASVSLKSVQ